MLQYLFMQGLSISDKIILAFASIFTILISISFHEMFHAWSAYRLGDDTGQRAGRITMNPLAHLDPIGTVMMLVAFIGWAKPTPINPVLFTRAKTMKRGIIEVSLAGPLSNLVLAFFSYLILNIINLIQFLVYKQFSVIDNIQLPILSQTTGQSTVIAILVVLFQFMVMININLAIFNLLPIPPLDGYKIFGSLLPNEIYYKIMQYERYIGMAFLFLLLFGRNFLFNVMDILRIPFEFIIKFPLDQLFNWINSLIK